MKEDRFERLRQAYPDASHPALYHLPDVFEKDAAKAEAFFKTWAVAEDLASVLESRVLKFAKHFEECFPGALPAGFKDLADKHSGLFFGASQMGGGSGRRGFERVSLRGLRRRA